MFYYPFDNQQCFLLLQLNVRQELVKFSGDMASVVYLEDRKLPAYLLTDIYIEVIETGSNQTRYSTLSVSYNLLQYPKCELQLVTFAHSILSGSYSKLQYCECK